jgi:starvation-inducible DNA-binding protein
MPAPEVNVRSTDNVGDLRGAVTAVLAEVFALYLRSKMLDWQVRGEEDDDYSLIDQQVTQLLSMTDTTAMRIRTLRGRVRSAAAERRRADEAAVVRRLMLVKDAVG